MLDWLRRLLGVPSPRPRRHPPGGEATSAPPGVGEPAPGEAREPEPPFAPFARALGVPLPDPPPPPDGDGEAAELALGQRILDHVRGNKLGPSSAPSLSLRILNMVASPGVEIAELSRLISADPALSAGVLNVANSAFFRGLSEIETVRDAVARLGLEEVGRVAGALSARSLFNPRLRQEQQAFGPRFDRLYRRAIVVATGAASLALRRPGGRSDRAYLGGMLHDVGRTVALRAVAALAVDGALGFEPADPRVEGAIDRVHLEIGGELHQAWALPQYLTVLAVRHHDPEIPADPEFTDLHLVRLAAAVHDLKAAPPAQPSRAAAELVQSAAALRLDPNAVRALAGELRQAGEKVATAFGLGPAAPPSRR